MNEGQFTVVLFKNGGKDAGVDRVLASNDNHSVALGLYDLHRIDHPDRLVKLCDGARIIRRSDRID
jgi:hypothetical protein